MEPYSEIKIHKGDQCYKLSCKIRNTQLTHLKWLGFVDELSTALIQLGKDPNVHKFYMFFDLTHLNPMMNNSYYTDIFNIFKENHPLFIDKLLGTFVYIDNHGIHLAMKIFVKLYTPIKPLFLLNTRDIDPVIVDNLLRGETSPGEFKI
jgi:hypothetical protein